MSNDKATAVISTDRARALLAREKAGADLSSREWGDLAVWHAHRAQQFGRYAIWLALLSIVLMIASLVLH